MIDVKAVRADPEPFRRGVARKGTDPAVVDRLLEADAARRALQSRTDDLRAEQKAAGREIASAAPEAKAALVESMATLKTELSQLEKARVEAEETFEGLLLAIPNPAHESVPDGETDDDNVEVMRSSDPPPEIDGLRDHHDLGTALGVIDTESGARVSGSRFAYLLGDAVRIQVALERLALDLLEPKGFVPVVPPVLVREEAMYGTGFFPTDRAQIYATEADDLYLVGTSEVPLAALHADEILDASDLPLRYLGISSCFRREAGTYGKDTRGIFRVHQFDKFEMFSFVEPGASWDEHDFLLECQREVFDALGLVYRVVNVCGGDLGAPAAKKYDIECWLPSEGRWREATSTSNTTDYQARRLKVRVRDAGSSGTVVAHTLNGTAVAVGRMITFLLEQGQQPDGSVVVPDALVARGAPAVLGPPS